MKYVRPLNLFMDLHKAKPRGRILGLDVGDKYVGLAISDPSNKIAHPVSVLLRKKSTLDLMAEDFNSLVSMFSVAAFVVGYPFTESRRGCPEAVQVKLLVEDLCKTRRLQGVKYTYWNECFTSKNGEYLLKDLRSFHPVEQKTIVDKFAAVGILQEAEVRSEKSITVADIL
ncbi:uncharacterized protein LOC126795125 isoform X2 [Argentina anserina]|uniref:uncharacterized protein LOC126795125 isoform X2 n=1 Tax=Argentina anserina TaxID=57926 RepID=UPI0021762C56|nr:uncharacterized protein LOC126795125 isoform X2 [Potentilla anserina]